MKQLNHKYLIMGHFIKGFTLVETLLAFTVFAVGTLGIAVINGNALKVSSNNYTRSTAVNTSRQVMNQFFIAATQSATAFKTVLDAFDDDSTDNYSNTQTISGENMLITIVSAEDDSSTAINLLTSTAAATTWVSPLSIAVKVTYAGVGDNDTSNDHTVNASYTFVLP